MRYGIVKVSAADLRRSPSHRSEMISQGLLGALVEIFGPAVGDGWLKVALPDGYRGWMRCWNLAMTPKAGAFRWVEQAQGIVFCVAADVLSSRDFNARRIRDLTLGCRVIVRGGRPGWTRIVLPDGLKGWVRAGALGATKAADGKALVNTARLFLGAPYLWGGVSPRGPDCSGLVQTTYAVHGISLPRDVSDQCHCGEDVSGAELRAGDLLFFGSARAKLTHVGLSTGGPGFIHAGCPVEEASLDARATNYQRRRAPHFRLARRILPNA